MRKTFVLFIFCIIFLSQFNFNCFAKNNIVGQNYEYYKSLPEEKYGDELKLWYKSITGKELNLDNPETFDEKIQWLKLNDRNPLKTKLADKYEAREWVKEKIGEKYLIPLLGVWDSFDDIDFSKLPERFILKTNHGCGFNYIVNKDNMNIEEIKNKFEKWLNINFAFVNGFELHYKNIKPKIIAEEFILKDETEKLLEYKILCIHGEPVLIRVISDRFGEVDRKFFDTQWTFFPLYEGQKNEGKGSKRPSNLEEILEISKTLSKDFPLVRVDLYLTSDSQIKFGELTFTPESGLSKFPKGKDFNAELGRKLILKG